MLRTFVQILTLLLTVEAAYFLARSNVGLTVETIAQLSATYLDANPQLLRSLSGQSSDTRVGIFLLVLSFALALANLLWPMTIGDFAVSGLGAALGLGLGAAVFFVCLRVSKRMTRTTEERVKLYLDKVRNRTPSVV